MRTLNAVYRMRRPPTGRQWQYCERIDDYRKKVSGKENKKGREVIIK
jgi:hypothetical protein